MNPCVIFSKLIQGMVAEATPETDKKRILVIDDDKQTCEFYRSILEGEDFHVETIHGGEAALTLLKDNAVQKFSLIVLDLIMPRFSGYEILDELKKPGYQAVPVFLITVRTPNQETINRIKLESDVRAFLSKPFDPQLFKNKVHDILGTIPKQRKPS